MRKQLNRLSLAAGVALIFFVPSCSIIAKKVNGTKALKTESPESVNQWLKSRGLAGYEVFTVDPEYFYDVFMFYQKRKLVFNRNGQVAEIGSNKTGVVCHITTPNEMKNLKPGFPRFTEYLINTNRSFENEEEYKKGNYVETIDTTYYNIDSLNTYTYTLDGDKTKIEKNTTADYMVVIPFAKYEGNTLQITEIRKYLKAIRTNKYSTFKVYLLNLDKHAWWGVEWNNKINMEFHY